MESKRVFSVAHLNASSQDHHAPAMAKKKAPAWRVQRWLRRCGPLRFSGVAPIFRKRLGGVGLIVFYVFLFCRKFGVALFYFLPHLSIEVNLPKIARTDLSNVWREWDEWRLSFLIWWLDMPLWKASWEHAFQKLLWLGRYLLKSIPFFGTRHLFQVLTHVACVPGKSMPAYRGPQQLLLKQAEDQEILLALEGVEEFLGFTKFGILWRGKPPNWAAWKKGLRLGDYILTT